MKRNHRPTDILTFDFDDDVEQASTEQEVPSQSADGRRRSSSRYGEVPPEFVTHRWRLGGTRRAAFAVVAADFEHDGPEWRDGDTGKLRLCVVQPRRTSNT